MLRFGSLFAGVGGFDLGFERAGLRCAWQVEIDPFCRDILERHWPGVRRHGDVGTFPPGPKEDWLVDVICGGFPCQDISIIGTGLGLDGARSGLWSEFARVVRVLRPRYVVVENSPALLGRGLGRVLGDLASVGYDAEWDCIPACAVGAPHLRERLWLVAHTRRERLEGQQPEGPAAGPVVGGDRDGAGVAPLSVLRGLHLHDPRPPRPRLRVSSGRGLAVEPLRGDPAWSAESPVCRVADGIPDRAHRIRAIGNAVVPQIAEFIGRRLIDNFTQEKGRPS